MAEPTKPIKVTCVVCSQRWETVPVDGYYECGECGYMNQLPWMPEGKGWRPEGSDA